MARVVSSSFKSRDIKEVFRILGTKDPKLTKLGEKAPKTVVSFGGSGGLITYSLGVAQYILDHHPSLINQSYFIGTGSGSLPAICLPLAAQLGKQHLPKQCFEYITKQSKLPLHSFSEITRREYVRTALAKFLCVEDIERHLLGRCSIFLRPDSNYIINRVHGVLDRGQILYGLPISQWKSSEDLLQCIEASMAPSEKHSIAFRGIPMLTASKYSFSPQVEQSIRHIFVHGYAGKGFSSNEKLHAHVFGMHGSLFNVSTPYYAQRFALCFPRIAKYFLSKAYDQGYKDAADFSRWEEDPYNFAKGTD